MKFDKKITLALTDQQYMLVFAEYQRRANAAEEPEDMVSMQDIIRECIVKTLGSRK